MFYWLLFVAKYIILSHDDYWCGWPVKIALSSWWKNHDQRTPKFRNFAERPSLQKIYKQNTKHVLYNKIKCYANGKITRRKETGREEKYEVKRRKVRKHDDTATIIQKRTSMQNLDREYTYEYILASSKARTRGRWATNRVKFHKQVAKTDLQSHGWSNPLFVNMSSMRSYCTCISGLSVVRMIAMPHSAWKVNVRQNPG